MIDLNAWAVIMATLAQPSWQSFRDVGGLEMVAQAATANPSDFTCAVDASKVCDGIWDNYVSPCDGNFQTCEECYQQCLTDCMETYDAPWVCWTGEDMLTCVLEAQRRRDLCLYWRFRQWNPPMQFPVDTRE
jgi:hypothetical protein